MDETVTHTGNERLQYIRGLPFPNVSWFPKKYLEETFDYYPHDGDIIIASYPKTGTTWLQYIVQQILTKGVSFPTFQDLLLHVSPFFEMAGAAAVDALKPPRVYKHHYPYDMVRKNERAKYLYSYRNPADTFVSYYHFMGDLSNGPLDFDEFFEDFLSGNIGYGRYFEHILSYLSYEDPEKLLLVSYERLQADRECEILRIAKFLGESYYQELLKEKSLLNLIIKHTSFEYMKKNLYLDHPGATPGGIQKERVNFFRKGVVGDGKKSLSPDQLKRLSELVMEVMKGTRIVDEWRNTDCL